MKTNSIVNNILNNIAASFEYNKESIFKSNNMGLYSGLSGISLFMFYMYKHYNIDNYKLIGYEYLEQSIEKINNKSSSPTLCSGIAGVNWTINHLVEKSFIESENTDILCQLDDYLCKSMLDYAKKGDFDFLHGATGIAFYLSTRLKSNKDLMKYLNEYIKFLEIFSIKVNDHIKLESTVLDFATATAINDKKRIKVYNLSLSHGISSIIIVLSKIFLYDCSNKNILRLINGLSEYLLSNQNIKLFQNKSMFPGSIPVDNPQNINGSRLAWCYGDIGNGLALYFASQATNNTRFLEKSFEIFKNTANRTSMDSIKDACVCHGSAGLVEIFNSLYHTFNDNIFRNSEEYWVNSTIDFYKSDNDIKSFSTYGLDGSKFSYGLLEGISGIGLALLSHLNKKNTNWNEFLLLS